MSISKVSPPTENTPTARSTSPSRDIDGVTTLSPISDSTESGTFQPPEALAATSTSAISTSSDSNVNRISRAQTNVGVVVGSVIGTVLPVTILLSVVAILTLALAQLARKYKSIVRRQGFRNPAAHNAYTVDVEMKSNEAYQSQFRSRLDSMESNAAYGGATVHQEAGNNLYETIRSFEISHEDNIAQACDRSTEQVKNETDDFTGSTVYEYIEEDDR